MPSKDERLFLYIDILGFSELIERPELVTSIYNKIDRLNVFDHEPYFKCIVFSDTIIVYSEKNWKSTDRPSASIMWMCEFAQNLFYRLIRKNIHFRAILTAGDFHHKKMKNIEAFYGESLVRTYQEEKNISGMGLYLDNSLASYSSIFKLSRHCSKYHYVHLMQMLDEISFKGATYPLHSNYILPMGHECLLVYDIVYLRNLFRAKKDMNLSAKVRSKYTVTWDLIRNRHRELLDTLEATNFSFRRVSNFSWNKEIRRFLKGNGFHG